MTCAYPRCKYEHSVVYITRPLCLHHWSAVCDEATDGRMEPDTLAALGLVRNVEGEVVEAKESKP